MPKPDKDYRENFSRSIQIFGEINQDLVHRLTPEILKLRAESTEPITVYIDSRGGVVRFAEVLSDLLTAKNADNRTCRIITIVTASALSAAADLLASGDYSISYPNSLILMHGVRRSTDEDITVEGASSLMAELKQRNDLRAVRLAKHIFSRTMVVFIQLKETFEQIRKDEKNPKLGDIECFARALSQKLTLPELSQLVMRTVGQYNEIMGLTTELADRFVKMGGFEKLRIAERQVHALNLILEKTLKRNSDVEWGLGESDLQKVESDYLLLMDYHQGPHRKWVEIYTRRYGKFFLTKAEEVEYEKLATKGFVAQRQWLQTTTAPRIQPIWYFVVALCRLLHHRDYFMGAEDAYWLGIVDEVLGSSLGCMREVVEEAAEAGDGGPPDPAAEQETQVQSL